MKNKSIQTEIDACYLYMKLAENESDVAVANVFRQIGRASCRERVLRLV